MTILRKDRSLTNVCSGLSVRGTFDGEVSTPEKSVTLVEKSPILLADHTPFYDEGEYVFITFDFVQRERRDFYNAFSHKQDHKS